MAFNIAFYVHHHGSGHLMRSLAIAAHLQECNVTLLGSDLDRYRSIMPEHFRCIDLPKDTRAENDYWFADREVEGLHYAPLNIAGQSERVSVLSKFFSENTRLLLVVDVSVEVAMLATLCGIPTIVVRQHGKRHDLPHTLAYKNAVGLLAPYGSDLQPEEERWLTEKTFFAGGISRYSPKSDTAISQNRQVGVLVGRGGTSIDGPFISELLRQCEDWHFHIVGDIAGITTQHTAGNLTYHGNVADPAHILCNCCVIIGNCGHNTVMEVAALNKRMIVIPEPRPFQEQVIKAQMLEKLHLARVVMPEFLLITDWLQELNAILLTDADWKNTIVETAALDAANYLKAVFFQHYQFT